MPDCRDPLSVTFLGSGDAFGSGGRFQTCILVETSGLRFLIDCGASSLIAMRANWVDPATIDRVLLTHLHGDHFGGLPFLIVDAQYATPRERPLHIAGPPGTAARLRATMEALYPGTWEKARTFPIAIDELAEGQTRALGELRVTPFPAVHHAGDPCYALRVGVAGRTITYTGDTGWSDALIEAAADADLFIAECYFYDRPTTTHMSWETWQREGARLHPRRTIYTHLGQDMLARLPELNGEFARDGLRIEL